MGDDGGRGIDAIGLRYEFLIWVGVAAGRVGLGIGGIEHSVGTHTPLGDPRDEACIQTCNWIMLLNN